MKTLRRHGRPRSRGTNDQDCGELVVDAAWLARRRVRVACSVCGEAVNYAREVSRDGGVQGRACAGERYYDSDGDHTGRLASGRTLVPTTDTPGRV